MYLRATSYPLSRLRFFAVCTVLLFGAVKAGYGQDQVRNYASKEEFHGQALLGLLFPGTIVNDANAVDKDPRTYSTLSVTAGALNQMLATQYLDFEEVIPAGTPVTVKLTLPVSTLGLVDNFRVQPYTNLNLGGGTILTPDRWRADPAGVDFEGADLLNLLAGKGTVEFTIVPTADFEGIWIELGSVVGLGVNMDVYHAYTLEDSPALNCEEKNEVIDVLHGVRAGAADLLGALSSVNNPYEVMSADLSTYAEMTVAVGALNTVYLNTIFQTPSIPNQNVRIILENPIGLLELSLLSQFKIQPYLGDVPAGPELENINPLLHLRLLPGSTKAELAFNINQPFDRIEIRLDNTVSLLSTLRVYEVSRLPRLMIIDDPELLTDLLTNCGSVDLQNAIANYSDLYQYGYYTTANSETPLPSSVVTASGTYYIEAFDSMTDCASDRLAVTASINGKPSITLGTIEAICEGKSNTASLPYTTTTSDPNQYSIIWDAGAPLELPNVIDAPLTPINNITINVPETLATGVYTAKLTVKNSITECVSEDYPVSLVIVPTPSRPQMNISNVSN